jgi:hypothetical protein
MQTSTLRDIDIIRSGDLQALSGLEAKRSLFASMSLTNRIEDAADLVRKMASKGKRAEAEAILDEFRERPVPVSVVGGGPEALAELARLEELRKISESDLQPIKGSGTAAQAEERRREELRTIREDDARWLLVVDEIHDRAR